MNNFSGHDQVITFSLDGLFTNYDMCLLSGDWDLTAFSFEKGFEAMLDAARLSNGLLDMPLLMLWRQSIELSLKSALYTLPPSQNCPEGEGKPNHDLLTLFKKIICRLKQLDANAEDDLSDTVNEVLAETQKIDPSATRFRYPSEKNGTPFQGLRVDYNKLRDTHDLIKKWADGIAVEFEKR